ncbi:MAG: MBL fold metallo-hydrolase [Xenococcaceae cyanobacterium]
MATDKPRVAAYLSHQNYQQLKEFCQKHGIKALSSGIDIILSKYFGSETLGSIPASTLGEVVTRAEVEELISQALSAFEFKIHSSKLEAYSQPPEVVEEVLKKLNRRRDDSGDKVDKGDGDKGDGDKGDKVDKGDKGDKVVVESAESESKSKESPDNQPPCQPTTYDHTPTEKKPPLPEVEESDEEIQVEDDSSKVSFNQSFSFTITGFIELVEDVYYLACQDGTRLRLKNAPPEIPATTRTWQVIPNTDSDGKIATVTVEASSEKESDSEKLDQCYISGRVIQLGKRSPLVLIKINRTGEKTLKLFLVGADSRMKVGQLWQVVACRQGDILAIKTASPLNSEQSSPTQTTFPTTTNNGTVLSKSNTKVLPDISPPTEVAIAALEKETGGSNWELGQPRRRMGYWEWECYSSSSSERARVQVSPDGAKVYQYAKSAEFEVPSSEKLLTPNSEGETNLVVTPLGAARGIGASCFQIQIGPYEVVLDCGTRPKGYDPLPALDYLENPDLLLISHSHQDHLGAVPVFHSRYPGAKMICTHGTREIAHIMLSDGLKLQQLNEDSPQLFSEGDLERTLFRLETYPVGVDFEPLPGLTIRFINAGHILGAACIYLRYGERTLIYTGDFHTTNSRTTTGLRLADLPEADILITESTYGADLHPARKTQETALIEAVASVVKEGGNVLIPAFALGRAQEILLALRTSALFHKLNVPVYVDGLVRAVTDVFEDNLGLLPDSMQNFAKQSGKEPFFDSTGTPPIIPIQKKRERPLAIAKPSIIVASSGMLVGGPSVYYAGVLLERENAAIFISGYTDEESPGRLLQNLKTGDKIELDGHEITVKAQIKRFNLSAHADKAGLGQVINKVNPKHLVLIHGCGDALHELARSGENRSKYYIHIPSVGERIEYGIPPEHLTSERVALLEQPAEFEVSIENFGEDAWLRVPHEVLSQDPRWPHLAESGLVRAKWDGFNLKLSSVSQEFLVRGSKIKKAIASGHDCCAVCQFFDRGKCCSPDSPLFEFKVDPVGVCPEFQRKHSAKDSQPTAIEQNA